MQSLLPIRTDERAYTFEEIAHDKPLVARDFPWLADHIIDFAWFRKKNKADNTDLGEKMVQQWTTAFQRMQQRHN
jgi:hypothetical protein